MANRSRASQKKRQRELKLQERQRDKMARREQRKLDKILHPEGESESESDVLAAPSEYDAAAPEHE
jgi:hypothetical protein